MRTDVCRAERSDYRVKKVEKWTSKRVAEIASRKARERVKERGKTKIVIARRKLTPSGPTR